jgi:hypothetical protein
MPILNENDISQDLLFYSSPVVCIDINQKGVWIEAVKVEEGRPIIGRFGEGLALNLENRI